MRKYESVICKEIYILCYGMFVCWLPEIGGELTGGWHGFFMPDAFRGLFGLLSDIGALLTSGSSQGSSCRGVTVRQRKVRDIRKRALRS